LKKLNLYWRLNHQIRAPEVRVLGTDDKQIGVMKLPDALNEARNAGLDLIEVAPKAKPPVVKIDDFGKFRYREEKKLRKQHSKAKSTELKEIRFSPFIGDADYRTRMDRIREFLADKNKVRTVVVFKGRQMGSKKFGYELLGKIKSELAESVVIDMDPKFIGRHLAMVISPTSKKVVNEAEK
jgi:translation initiation factor IF-3